MDKVVITGGAGFIGSHLVEALIKKNYDVYVFDNLSLAGVENLEKVKGKYTLAKGDIRNYPEVENAFKDAKCVFHLAALSTVGESLRIPEAYNDVNINGTVNVLKAAKQQNVARFVFSSSASVYGNVKNPIQENATLMPNSPYGISKICGEFYANLFYRIYGPETVCLRLFNAYGPRIRKKAVNYFAKNLFENKPPKITGDGKQIRDYVFTSDIVDAFLKAMKSPNKCVGKSYNVGTGKGHSMNELANSIGKILNKSLKPEYAPAAQAEVYELVANTRLAKQELGFSAQIKFKKGLRLTLEALRERNIT